MQEWIQRLDDVTGEFAQVLATGDPEADVPSCPLWTLEDLGDHLGGIHQWAAHAITHGTPDGPITASPPGREQQVAWYRRHAAHLVEVLKNTAPDAPVWAFGPKPRVASFWARRQVHETGMHLWDAQLSQGRDHVFDSALALDAIDEVLTVFFPRQVRLGRIPVLPHSLALEVSGSAPNARLHDHGGVGGGGRRFVLSGDGTSADPDAADATVSGPPDAVLLLLWDRIHLDDPRLTLTGDTAAARSVLSLDLTP